MARQDKTAVLLMAYGAAGSLEEIPAYLADIRGGRPVPEPLLSQVRARYQAMGGRSPLLEITRAQARALEAELGGPKVLVGMRHSEPRIAAAAARLASEGVSRVLALPLTPYFSRLSVGAYLEQLRAARAKLGAGFEILEPGSWHEEPDLVEGFARKTKEALERLPRPARAGCELVFTAHSLPERVLSEGDPYPAQFEAAAAAVAARLGFERFRAAYQSRGFSGEPWLGPEAGELLSELARSGRKAALLSPIGFVSDHMETLYDVDILYRNRARELGLAFERAGTLNDDPALIRALAAVVRRRLPV